MNKARFVALMFVAAVRAGSFAGVSPALAGAATGFVT